MSEHHDASGASDRHEAKVRGRRTIPHYLGLLVIVLLATLVLLDVGLRILDARAGRDASFYLPRDPHQDRLYQPHPYVGFALRPGYGSPETRAEIHVNSLGFRGPERLAKKPEGTYRIFCLGGSTTYGTGCARDEETYPAQLEGFLQKMAPEGRTYEVWNCGVSGYNSIESLVNFELRLLQYEPDAVVVYHAANDARPVQQRGFLPDYSHLRRSWAGEAPNELDTFLLRWWRLYAWVTRGTDPELQHNAIHAYVFEPGYKSRHIRASKEVNEAGVDVFVRNLRHIIAIARANDIEVMLSTFAMAPEKTPNPAEDYFETVRVMNDRIRALAAEEHVGLAEVGSALSDKPKLYRDWMHFNALGSRQHASVVVKAARDQGLFGLGD